MRFQRRIVSSILIPLLSIGFFACREDYGPPVHQRVQVDLALRGQPNGALTNNGTNTLNAPGTGLWNTSLVVAVLAGTAPTANFEQLEGFLGKIEAGEAGLLDLGTSVITLTLPVETPLKLLEYTFTETRTLADLIASQPVAGDPHVSPTFTVSASDTALDVSLPPQLSAYADNFDSGLNPVIWETSTSGVSAASGAAVVSASAVHDPSRSFDENRLGDIQFFRSNRNLLINKQRVAGTFRIDSAAAIDAASPSTAAHSRAAARLIYRPRANRGQPDSTNTTVVRVEFRQLADGTIRLRLQGGFCLSGDCQDPAEILGFDAAHTANFSTPVVPGAPPSYPFSLEYVGNNIFVANFNGETKGIDMSDIPGFNANDFLYALMRSQGRYVVDSGDSASITAAFDNMVVGQPGFDPNAPVRLADSIQPYEDFFTNLYDVTRLGERFVDGGSGITFIDGVGDFSQSVDTVAAALKATFSSGKIANFPGGSTQISGFSELSLIPGQGITGLGLSVTHPAAGSPTAGAGFIGTNIDSEFFKDPAGNIVQVSLGLSTDYSTSTQSAFWSARKCDVTFTTCTNIGGGPVPGTFSLGSPADLGLIWVPETAQFVFNAGIGSPITVDFAITTPPNPGVTNPTAHSSTIPSGQEFLGIFNFANFDALNKVQGVQIHSVDVDANGNGLLDASEGTPQPPFEDFTASPLDPTKWEEAEGSRNLSGQKITLSQAGGFQTLPLFTGNPPKPFRALSADVKVTQHSGDGRAFLASDFYDATEGPVIGLIGMSGSQVIASIVRENTSTELLTGVATQVLGAVTLGSTHKLFMQWNGATANFQLDSNPVVTLDPRADAPIVNSIPARPFTELIVGNINEALPFVFGTGSITAEFSDVRAGRPTSPP